jgi:diaminopimelate decarboxylase
MRPVRNLVVVSIRDVRRVSAGEWSGPLGGEGWDRVELAVTYGTPLFVLSEHAIRANYRRFSEAFTTRYPDVVVCASTKANYGLAVRRVFAQEGAGADCFGVSELYITLLVGTDPGRWLTSNVAVLLGRVGVVKETSGIKKWVHVDASTNSLNWVGNLHMIAANKATHPASEGPNL